MSGSDWDFYSGFLKINSMEWKEFTEMYGSYSEEFNEQEFDERCRVSRLMTYEVIRELIKSKKYLNDAISKINERIKQLTPELDKHLKSKAVVYKP